MDNVTCLTLASELGLDVLDILERESTLFLCIGSVEINIVLGRDRVERRAFHFNYPRDLRENYYKLSQFTFG